MKKLILGNLFLLLGELFLVQCKTKQKTLKSDSDLIIISATKQEFKGGVKGSPSGLKFKITLISPGTENDFIPSYMTENGQKMKAQAKSYKGLPAEKVLFKKGDTLEIICTNILYSPESNSEMNHTLEYKLNKINKYQKLPVFTELQPELRP